VIEWLGGSKWDEWKKRTSMGGVVTAITAICISIGHAAGGMLSMSGQFCTAQSSSRRTVRWKNSLAAGIVVVW